MKAKEKNLELRLRKKIGQMGGVALKFQSPFNTGWPDRFVLMPGGKLFLVELKSEGKKLTLKQNIRITQARLLGFVVFVVDSDQTLDAAIEVMEITQKLFIKK